MADDINQAIAGLADYLKQLTAWASLNDKTRAKKGQPKVQQKIILAFEAFLRRHDAHTQHISDAVLSALIAALPPAEHRLCVPPKILALLGCTVCRVKQSKVKNELHSELESWIECLTREPSVAKNSDWTGEWVHLLFRTFVDESSTWDVRINAISMLSKLQENEADIKQIVMQTGVGQKCLLRVGDALMTVPEFSHITTLANFIRLLIPKRNSEERLKYFFRDAYFSRSLCGQFSEFLRSDSVALALALNEERRKHNKALATLDLQDVFINSDDKREINEGQAVVSDTCLVVVLRMDETWSICRIGFKEIASKTLLGPTLVLKSKDSFESTDTQTIHLRFLSIDQAKEAERQLPGTAQLPPIARTSIASIRVPPLGQQSAQSLTAKERGEKLSEMVQWSPSPMNLPASRLNPYVAATQLAVDETQDTEEMEFSSLAQSGQPKRRHGAPQVAAFTEPIDLVKSVVSQSLPKQNVSGTPNTVEVTQVRIVETVNSVLTAPPPPPLDETISDAPIFQIAPPRSMQKHGKRQFQGLAPTEASRATPTESLMSPPPFLVSGSSAGNSPSVIKPSQPVERLDSRIIPHNSKEVNSLFDAMASSHARSLTQRPAQSNQEPANQMSGSTTTDDSGDGDVPARETEAPPDLQQKAPDAAKVRGAKETGPARSPQIIAGRQTYKAPGKKQPDEPEASDLSSPSPPPAKQPTSTEQAAATSKVKAQLKKSKNSLNIKVAGAANDDAETDYDMPTSPMQKPKTKRGAAAKKKARAKKQAASKKKTPARRAATIRQDSDVEEDAVLQDVAPSVIPTGLRMTRAQTSRAKQATRGGSRGPAQDSSDQPRAAPSSNKKRKNRNDFSEDEQIGPSKKHASPVSMPRIEHLVNDNAVKRPEIVHWTKQGPERGQTGPSVVPVEQVDQNLSRQASVGERACGSGMEVGYVNDQGMSPMAALTDDNAQVRASQALVSHVSPAAKAVVTQKIVWPRPTKQTDRLSIQRLISSDPIQDTDELPNTEEKPMQEAAPIQSEQHAVRADPDLAARACAPRMPTSGGVSSTQRPQVPSTLHTAVEGSAHKLAPEHQAAAQSVVRTPLAMPGTGRPQHLLTPSTVLRKNELLEQSVGIHRAAATSTIGQIQRTLNTTSMPAKRTVLFNQPESTPIRLGGQNRTVKVTEPSATSRAAQLRTTATTRTEAPAIANKLHMLLQQRGLLPEPVVPMTANDQPELDSTDESSDETDHQRSQKKKRGKSRLPSYKQSLPPLHREAYEILENATRELIQSLQQSEARLLGVADDFATQCDGVLGAFRESSDASATELLEKLNVSIRVCLSS